MIFLTIYWRVASTFLAVRRRKIYLLTVWKEKTNYSQYAVYFPFLWWIHSIIYQQHHHHHHHQRVLPNGRSFTANSGTTVVVLPKAGLPPQTQKPRLQFYEGWIGAVVSRCLPHPTLSLASEQTLKDLKRSQGHHVEVRRVDLANWALRTSPKFITDVKYQFHQGFLTKSEIRKFQSPFAPV